jgi:hypothetical protein
MQTLLVNGMLYSTLKITAVVKLLFKLLVLQEPLKFLSIQEQIATQNLSVVKLSQIQLQLLRAVTLEGILFLPWSHVQRLTSLTVAVTRLEVQLGQC